MQGLQQFCALWCHLCKIESMRLSITISGTYPDLNQLLSKRTILKPTKALAAQSDKLFETQLAKCPLPPNFWRGSDIYKHDTSGFHALTMKPLTFTSIMTGSIGTFSNTDDPPLYDGMHQSRMHGLSFSPMDSFIDLNIDFKMALDLLKNHNFTFKTKKGQLKALRILVGADSILPDTLEYELLLGGRKYGEPR